MFFSRIHIQRGPAFFQFTRSDVKDSLYAAHKLLWKAFPEAPNAPRDFLFRQEVRQGLPCFFVVSARRPVNHDLFKIETKDYTPQITNGQRLAFSLTANPVIARKAEGKKHSEKHDVWMDAKREAKEMRLDPEKLVEHCMNRARQWLVNRAEPLGFSTEDSQVNVDGYFQHQFYRRKSRPIRFSSLNYEGVLTVTDPELFLRTLYEGIGRSRAFGCGLMLVRRL